MADLGISGVEALGCVTSELHVHALRGTFRVVLKVGERTMQTASNSKTLAEEVGQLKRD
jgi:hypothetical protein